jgi:hypothetical protein
MNHATQSAGTCQGVRRTEIPASEKHLNHEIHEIHEKEIPFVWFPYFAVPAAFYMGKMLEPTSGLAPVVHLSDFVFAQTAVTMLSKVKVAN